ncbi:hypothetical protein ISE00_20255 [Pseudomonas aeruginosa]|nr:hypothetical protein [Pseudomonas aeruginosa]MBG6729164.1 hypothetical protein [Pseudomonas aeruginosa]MBX5748491.1 hypothetical protein [Pseudomonas aeruginosa]MCT5439707.1 hypothetical protein [Pseudomonas aeruginosa]MDI2409691.1 hypothetical protein [Pseudomonas aeruginosa]MDY1536444.1 hypothetical protein [Pseudomonas aeruginosa]
MRTPIFIGGSIGIGIAYLMNPEYPAIALAMVFSAGTSLFIHYLSEVWL